MPKRIIARRLFLPVVVAPAVMLASCADPDRWGLTIDKVGPEYVPAIQMKGTIQRIAAMTVSGSPASIAPAFAQVQSEGWKARLVDQSAIEIDPIGHTLDQVAALNFRFENGEFGDLKFNVVMREDRKATARAQAR